MELYNYESLIESIHFFKQEKFVAKQGEVKELLKFRTLILPGDIGHSVFIKTYILIQDRNNLSMYDVYKSEAKYNVPIGKVLEKKSILGELVLNQFARHSHNIYLFENRRVHTPSLKYILEYKQVGLYEDKEMFNFLDDVILMIMLH